MIRAIVVLCAIRFHLVSFIEYLIDIDMTMLVV